MNSNTKGSEVANVGFWPKDVLGRILTSLNILVGSVKGIQSGQLIPVGVDFSTKGANDDIPDIVMGEITRRLVVTFESPQPGAIIFSPTPPEDHTKGWWQTDPVTNLPIGTLKKWNPDTGKWEDVDPTGAFVPPLQRSLTLVSPAGTSTINGVFADIKTTNYKVALTPTTYQGGAWAAPAPFGASPGYQVVNKTSSSISVVFYAMPAGGLVWECDITAR